MRLRLKGIEAMCSDYITENDDTELLESIQNWHEDYRTLQRRWTAEEQTSTSTKASFTSPTER